VPNTIKALTIVKPDTVIRWHRAGFRSYWRWKSRHRCGRPTAPLEIRRLIREMSIANPLWGAPRIHGELLKRPHHKRNQSHSCKTASIGAQLHQRVTREKQNLFSSAAERFPCTEDVAGSIPALLTTFAARGSSL
jgi:hypothetical protein